MNPVDYFGNFDLAIKKKYDALREYFYKKRSAKEVAEKYSYTLFSFYSLIREFNNYLKSNPSEDYFFKNIKPGRKPRTDTNSINEQIINLRKLNYSTEDIRALLHSQGCKISYGYINTLLKKEGFARLLRRSKHDKYELQQPKMVAPISKKVIIKNENYFTRTAGIFCLLPIIKKYGIDTVIYNSDYPSTKNIPNISSILSFLALKLSNIKRYSADDIWCMDKGSGLFSGLTALPKTAWYSSYSHRVTRNMNLKFLKSLNKIWLDNNLLSDTRNLDFKTIPYWGDEEHLENNWSGNKNKALSSMLAVLSQEPEIGIIDYGNTDVMHENESAVVIEYLDFYKKTDTGNKDLKYLIFDSKFTNYENLAKLTNQNINFITIRKRGNKMIERFNNFPSSKWKKKRVEASGLKKRTLKYFEEIIILPGYSENVETDKNNKIRQIIITGHGKIKPAVIITNDFDLKIEDLIRKYCRRWIIEKEISEQIDFFHLNRVSSSMVIKVDFDLTMSILAHNIYRLLAKNLGMRYSHFSDQRIFQKFVDNSGNIKINEHNIIVELKKKRELPQLLTMFENLQNYQYEWLDNCFVTFAGGSTT
jgi:hypothetical protein